MTYRGLTNHNIMSLWLYDTCNFRCGYCGLVTSGDVTRTEQLQPYRDSKFIEQILRFFRDNRPGGRPWAVLVTGGEPTMMPNLDEFVLNLGRQGDAIAIYTNMSISLDKVLSEEALPHVAYAEASFHPDWHMGKFDEDKFFSNVTAAKDRGVPVLVRFVGAPQVLDLLGPLEERCRSIGVSFFPTTLFNPEYPRSYTPAERLVLGSRMVGYSSLIQLDGGLVMDGRKCLAGDRMFAARLHKGGDVTPCISVDKPVLGNVYANVLHDRPGLKNCYKADRICSCDVHFQQKIVDGVDDSEEFARILQGQGVHRADEYETWKHERQIETSDKVWVGQGVVTSAKGDLLRVAPKK